MGMFDKPRYLTGEGGFVEPGDTFWLHNAKIDGSTTVNGDSRPQAKLQVSRERDSEKVVVFTSGRGITNQIGRMDASDRANLPMEVRLDEIPATQSGRQPTRVLNPATSPEPAMVSDDDASF